MVRKRAGVLGEMGGAGRPTVLDPLDRGEPMSAKKL
jgi:hypothetical protein